MEGLNSAILQKIFSLEMLPTTISKWYEVASRFDAQHHRAREILSQRRGTQNTTSPRKNYFLRYTATKDPNAMDIDHLTTEEREKHMQENRCFNCHKIGHRAKECRGPKNDNSQRNNNDKFHGVKKTAATARAMIRSLVAEMEDGEKEKLWKDINDDQDF